MEEKIKDALEKQWELLIKCAEANAGSAVGLKTVSEAMHITADTMRLIRTLLATCPLTGKGTHHQ